MSQHRKPEITDTDILQYVHTHENYNRIWAELRTSLGDYTVAFDQLLIATFREAYRVGYNEASQRSSH